jgi:hypothetical protein
MQTLAALMVSMLLTTALFTHALVATDERPQVQPSWSPAAVTLTSDRLS